MFSIIFTTVALALGGGNLEDTLRLAVEYNFPVTMIGDVIVLLILLYFFRKDSLRLMPVKMKITPFHWILIAVCGISCCLAANYLISLSGLIQLFYEQYEEVSSLLYYGNIWQELILMAVAAPVLEDAVSGTHLPETSDVLYLPRGSAGISPADLEPIMEMWYRESTDFCWEPPLHSCMRDSAPFGRRFYFMRPQI